MNRLSIRYLVVSFVATAAVGILIQLFLLTLLERNQGLLAGAALVAGWWGNLATAGTVAIFAARKAAEGFTDPRLGRVLGLSIGVWVGVGAIAGLVAAALVLGNQVPDASIRPGLIVIFGLVSMLVCLIAGMLAGREAAQPPEAEEEA
jgi:MFS family permease